MTLLLLAVFAAATLETPVNRVVNLLKDMKTRLEADSKADAELYEQLECWCETNNKEKSAAVDAAQASITELGGTIEELSAKGAELKSTIEQLMGEIAKDTKALAQATSLRESDAAAFSGDEKDLLTSIKSVGDAVNTLSKHHGDNGETFLQMTPQAPVVAGVKAALSRQELLPSQRKLLASFIQQAPSAGSYSSRSGAIFGILQQMKETFESNLSSSQKEELQSQREYASLKAAKLRGITAAKQQVMDKTAALASADEGIAHAKHDLKLTREQLSADNKFILDLRLRCNNGDAAFAERSKLRAEEVAAVADVMKILTDDSARDLFSSTLGNPSFIQAPTPARAQAAALLRKAATTAGSPALLQLAYKAQLDAFVKVNAAIDEMVTDLKKEMADEVEHRDFCAAELRKNEKSTDEKQSTAEDLATTIADKTSSVDTLVKEIAALNKEVAETQVEIKRASENREKENQDFQQTVADQRATQTILTKALQRMQQTYGGKAKSLLQGTQPAQAEYKRSESGNGVLEMLKDVIHDAVTLEKESLHAEQEAQSAYQTFVNDSASSVNTARRSVASKVGEKAGLEGELVQAQADASQTSTDLASLARYNGELHTSCDYVLNNFEGRQEARGQEIDALGQAKAILSGADFGF